jgi:hypothetical protein
MFSPFLIECFVVINMSSYDNDQLCPLHFTAPGILDDLTGAVMDTAESKRNPVVQVAVLSVLGITDTNIF